MGWVHWNSALFVWNFHALGVGAWWFLSDARRLLMFSFCPWYSSSNPPINTDTPRHIQSLPTLRIFLYFYHSIPDLLLHQCLSHQPTYTFITADHPGKAFYFYFYFFFSFPCLRTDQNPLLFNTVASTTSSYQPPPGSFTVTSTMSSRIISVYEDAKSPSQAVPNCLTWDSDKVGRWIASLGLGIYSQRFQGEFDIFSSIYIGSILRKYKSTSSRCACQDC